MTFLDNLSPDEWAVIVIGCALVILVLGLIALALWHLVEALPGFIVRRLAVIPETSAIPTVPAAVPAADIDAEWADIEIQLEKSK